MNLAYYGLLICLGLISGTVSGLLGIGGALMIVPLLIYVPEWLGFATIDIRTATAIAVVQVTAATLSGAVAHGRRGLVHGRLAVVMSITTASGALIGGVTSAYVPSDALLVATALLATAAAALMAMPAPAETADALSHPKFSVWLALPAGAVIGLVIGLNGSGAFLMMPALIFLLKIPTRTALATVLAIGFPTSIAAVVGKVSTGQVPLWASVSVVLGALPGAQLGSLLSARASARLLRLLYGGLLLIIAFGLWYDVFHRAT